MKKPFPNYTQPDSKDCGPTCLQIVAKYYGKIISIQKIRQLSETVRMGSSLMGLSNAADAIGFKTIGVKLSLEKLEEVPLPCLLHWNKNHFVVLYRVKNSNYYISDPAHGLLKYNKEDFLNSWIGNNSSKTTEEGIALLLETTVKFYDDQWQEQEEQINLSYLTKYLSKYKKFLWQLIIGLLAGSLLQLIFPFLTQSIVDVGIKNQDINFIYLILFAQLALFIGRTGIEVIRSWRKSASNICSLVVFGDIKTLNSSTKLLRIVSNLSILLIPLFTSSWVNPGLF